MYRQETARLHAAARRSGFRIVIQPHAEKRMRERDISRLDVERLLRAGAVVMIETEVGGDEKWRVAGRDTDGGRIEAVVRLIPPALAILITAIRTG
jgi:hypothetical protein